MSSKHRQDVRFEPSVGVNRGSRYKARVKINRRHGTKCTSMYISYLRGCKANTLQARTTAVRAGSEMLRIFSSGKDAAGLNRSDVSASAETRYQKCTWMYTFDDATTQMPAYLQVMPTTARSPAATDTSRDKCRPFPSARSGCLFRQWFPC